MKSWPCASLPWPSGSASISIVGPNFWSWLCRKSLIFIFANLHFSPRDQRCITHGTTAPRHCGWLLHHCTPNGLSQNSVWSCPCDGIWGFDYFRPKRTWSLVAELLSHRECHCLSFGSVGCDTWSPTHHSGCKDGVSSLKRKTITCALQYSPLVDLSIHNVRCWLMVIPWSLLYLLHRDLRAQGCVCHSWLQLPPI